MKPGDDPTPQEIQERAAAIRATWEHATRLKRLGIVETPLTAPIYPATIFPLAPDAP